MATLQRAMASTKRAALSDSLPGPANKKPRTNFSDRTRYKESSEQIKHGIIVRPYYPPEMTDERARKYVSNEIERPIETLMRAAKVTATERGQIHSKIRKDQDCVVFWFKNDLRTYDNKGLHYASELAKSKEVPLICLYLISPQDWEAHLTSAVRVDFILRTLDVLKRDLAELDIPLYIETVAKRKDVRRRMVELCQEWSAKCVWCNMEYEVDELRREAQLTRDLMGKGISFNVEHDTCVVEPGVLKTGTGGQISVYSPWHRKWVAYLNTYSKVLEEYGRPSENHSSARTRYTRLFDVDIPGAPEEKRLTDEERKKFRSMWPPGEHEAMNRLQKFIAERITNYHNARNSPAANGTGIISVHLAAGTLAARTAVRLGQEAAPTKSIIDDRKQGHPMWIAEVAWRDFYKHVLVHWPYICMNKSFKPEYTNIKWEYNTEHFQAWCEGRTGFPIVDAAMHQLNNTGYMHNRCRMIVASFLAKDLLIDWRMGERYFMEHLIDGDFASNNGGWSFSASCGVDAQPYFRIFNPLLQSEKFDPDGEYIKKWVPELRGLDSQAIHDPYGRSGALLAKQVGYPKPIVDHKGARERALTRYKAGIGRDST